MDISELRKRILRAIDDARTDAAARRTVVDEAVSQYEAFLSDIAVPVVRQAAAVLNGSGYAFIVHTPAVGVRLAAEKSPDTFLELELDTSGDRPEVIGRVSVSRARHGQVVEERPIAPGTAVDALSDEEVSAFLVGEIPKLVTRR